MHTDFENPEGISLRIDLRALAAFSLALVLCLLAACKARRDSETLLVNIGTEPPTLDWSLATDHVSFNVIANLMVGLAEFDENMAPVPTLASSWEIEDGGRRYVFHLRKDARWSDGRPVTARDFVFSWRRILDPKTASEYAYLMFVLKNAKAINEGKMPPKSLAVFALDDFTLMAELEEPSAFFLSLVTFEITYPQREDVLARWGDAWTAPGHIVTNGAYLLKEWKHENEILLEANPDFFRGAPPISRARLLMVPDKTTAMTMFDRGELDLMDSSHSLDALDIPRYEALPSFERVPQLRGYYYGFNTQRPPFDDPRVRRAFGHAIDRRVFPKILRGGERPATSWIPPGMFAHHDEIGLAFDPEKARALLKEAGYAGPADFPKVTAVFNTAEVHDLVAQALQAQWRENLGVDVAIENVEWKVFLQMLGTDAPQLYRLGWGADYPDPDNFMNLFASYSGNNYTRWKSERFDRLIAEAARELNPEKRKALYDEAQRLLLEEAAVILPLFTTTENLVSQPWVEGFTLDAMARLRLGPIRFAGRPR